MILLYCPLLRQSLGSWTYSLMSNNDIICLFRNDHCLFWRRPPTLPRRMCSVGLDDLCLAVGVELWCTQPVLRPAPLLAIMLVWLRILVHSVYGHSLRFRFIWARSDYQLHLLLCLRFHSKIDAIFHHFMVRFMLLSPEITIELLGHQGPERLQNKASHESLPGNRKKACISLQSHLSWYICHFSFTRETLITFRPFPDLMKSNPPMTSMSSSITSS